jgi:hypothetical protein
MKGPSAPVVGDDLDTHPRVRSTEVDGVDE